MGQIKGYIPLILERGRRNGGRGPTAGRAVREGNQPLAIPLLDSKVLQSNLSTELLVQKHHIALITPKLNSIRRPRPSSAWLPSLTALAFVSLGKFLMLITMSSGNLEHEEETFRGLAGIERQEDTHGRRRVRGVGQEVESVLFLGLSLSHATEATIQHEDGRVHLQQQH